MTSSVHRGQRLLALALAASTVGVAALTTAASAQAATTTTHDYTGSADSAALQLVVTLPAAIAGPLGTALPNPIDLSLIRSTGTASHDGKNADVGTSISQLAQGSLLTSNALSSALNGVLNRSVTATLTAPNPAPVNVAALPANPPLNLNLAVAPLSASSNPSNKSTQGSGALTAGSLGSLSSLAPQLTVPLQAALTTLTTQLSAATSALAAGVAASSAVTTPLAGAITTINSALGMVPIPNTGIAGIPSALPAVTVPGAADLAATINQLPVLLNSVINQLLNGALLNLGAVTSSDGITPVAAGTTSTGATNTGDISLLGGLVTVVASKASATATATGTPGKAKADATATLVHVTLATALTNLLDVSASDAGITASLLTQLGLGASTNSAVTALVQPVNAAVNTILAQVVNLLQSLNSGIQVLQQGTTSTSSSTNGTHSEAHATPAQVIVGLVPPAAAGLPATLALPNLIGLSLGKVDVVANQENATAPAGVTLVVPPKKTVTKTPSKPVAPAQRLAYTGADLPLTAGAALVLLGAGGALARRRRRPATEL